MFQWQSRKQLAKREKSIEVYDNALRTLFSQLEGHIPLYYRKLCFVVRKCLRLVIREERQYSAPRIMTPLTLFEVSATKPTTHLGNPDEKVI